MKGKVKKWEDNSRRPRRFVTFSNFDTMGKAEVFLIWWVNVYVKLSEQTRKKVGMSAHNYGKKAKLII